MKRRTVAYGSKITRDLLSGAQRYLVCVEGHVDIGSSRLRCRRRRAQCRRQPLRAAAQLRQLLLERDSQSRAFTLAGVCQRLLKLNAFRDVADIDDHLMAAATDDARLDMPILPAYADVVLDR